MRTFIIWKPQRLKEKRPQSQFEGVFLCAFVSLWLLPLNTEIALNVIVRPRSHDGPIVQTEIFDFSIYNVMNRLAGGVFGIGLEVNRPSFRFESRILQLDRVGPGVDLTGYLFTVPVHDD